MRTFAAGWALCFFVLLLAGCGGSEDSYSDEMAEQHADDEPEATAAIQEPAVPVSSSAVVYSTMDAGERLTGYIAEPENPDSVLEARGMDPATSNLPGVIVIHEWWGLNDNIRAASRRLAGEGYRVLAVDLFQGATADTPDDARELTEAAMEDRDALRANLRAANTFLREEAEAPRVGILGWCFGGAMALEGALDPSRVLDALVIYYGRVQDADASGLDALQMPVLGHFGAEDGSIPLDEVRAFEQALEERDKEAQIHIYEGADHAFANPSGQNYHAAAADEAWDRTTRFLQQHLYPESTHTSAAE